MNVTDSNFVSVHFSLLEIIVAPAQTTSFGRGFCIGYMEAQPEDDKDVMGLPEAFLYGIEAEQE